MTYVENIFVLLAAPLVACLFVVADKGRLTVASLLSGMFACLLSSYLSAFFAAWMGMGSRLTAIEVAPVVEEVVKLLPLLYYLLVIDPDATDAGQVVTFVAVGFATMESAFYLAEFGPDSPVTLALRGLSASMMHLTCGVVVGLGMRHVWEHPWLKVAGSAGLLSMAIVFHGLYNLLVAAGGIAQSVALAIPLLALVVVVSIRRWKAWPSQNA